MRLRNTVSACLFRLTAIPTLVGLPVLITTASAATSGCAHTGPSSVSQGLLYAPGEPTYDQYFAALYEAQLKLGQAPDKEAALRQSLATAVGAPQADPKPLLEAVEKQVSRMKEAGLTIALSTSEPGSPPTATVEVTAGLAEPKDQRIIDAIQATTRGELELMAEMEEAKAAIAQLKDRAPALEPAIDQTFRKEGVRKKSEVRKNLEDAQRLIPLMEQRATGVGQTAEQMVQGLVKVANTTAETPAEPQPAEGEESGDATKAPVAPRPRPSPAPAPKRPSTSDGFEP